MSFTQNARTLNSEEGRSIVVEASALQCLGQGQAGQVGAHKRGS